MRSDTQRLGKTQTGQGETALSGHRELATFYLLLSRTDLGSFTCPSQLSFLFALLPRHVPEPWTGDSVGRLPGVCVCVCMGWSLPSWVLDFRQESPLRMRWLWLVHKAGIAPARVAGIVLGACEIPYGSITSYILRPSSFPRP